MIEGTCPRCGQRYFGWSLLQPRNQACARCGAGLLITEDGVRKIEGYSPFTAEEYKLKSPHQKAPDPEKAKDSTE
jgi:ribosomal protein S27AE